MNTMQILSFLLVCFVLSLNAFAFVDVSAPGSVYVLSVDKTISVSLSNPSSRPLPVDLRFVGPTSGVFSNPSLTLEPNGSTTVFLTLKPRAELSGQSYVSTILAEGGGELSTRRMDIIFKESETIRPSPQPDSNLVDSNSSAGPTGFFALFANPDVSGWLTTANLLNAALIVLAAILLIALITRLINLTR